MKWFSLFVVLIGLVSLAIQPSDASTLREPKTWSLLAFNRVDFPPKELKRIQHMVEGGTADEIHVHVLKQDLEKIRRWTRPHRVVALDVQTLRPRNLQKDIGGDYHTPQTMRAAFESMVELYPELARISVVGYSVDGRPIDAIVISDNISKRELDEPCLRMVAAYHGDEWASTEVAMATAWALLARHDSEPAVQEMVDQYEFWIIPILNPDGFVAFDRRNSNRVDLNRNFSWAYDQTRQSGDHAFSEPETLAIYDLSMTRAFHHNLSVHAGAANLGWVWNHQEAVSLDETWFRTVAEKYLETASTPGFWITNGAQWYIVNGESTDWLYGARAGHDYTLEVSVEKAPPAQTIPDLVEQHLESTLGFYKQPGFKGRVTTPTGESIEASITLEDGGGAMLSDPRTGAYYRPLAAGSYRVSASALGFSSVSESLDVSEGEVLDWNPVLTPILSIDIESFGVLSNATMNDAKDNAFIDSENLASMLGAGATLELYRVGVSDTYQVPLTIAGSRVYLELNNLERVLREQRGFWDLLVKDADGRVAHRFAQAVFLVDAVLLDDASSSYSLEKIEPGRYLFQGPAQQPGTELSFMGPGLRQSLPLRRMNYEPGYFRFELSAEDLAVGDWYVRLSQAGAFNRIPWLVRNDANELSLIEVSKALEELGRDALDPAGGCTCQSSQPMGWLVVLALGLRLLRRRQAYLFHKAG